MPNTDEQLARVARAIAKTDGLDWDEVCGYESGRDECDSSTCIAALLEDHDPDYARGFYSDHAQAAIAAMRDDWRPIETGRAQRRRVWVYVPEGTPTVEPALLVAAIWRDIPCARGDDFGCAWFDDAGNILPRNPIAWMPLPAPPAGERV